MSAYVALARTSVFVLPARTCFEVLDGQRLCSRECDSRTSIWRPPLARQLPPNMRLELTGAAQVR